MADGKGFLLSGRGSLISVLVSHLSGGSRTVMQRIQRRLFVFVLASTALGLWPAAAQFTANFQTNTISGVNDSWNDNYNVGYTNYANALIIRNAGALTVPSGLLGVLPVSSNNY